MERRVHTDIGCYVEDLSKVANDEEDFDPNEAYARMHQQEDSPNELEDNQQRDQDDQDLDYNNYKGIYFNDDPGQKYQDPQTGAHFNYIDMCRRLNYLIKKQKQEEAKMYALHTEPAHHPQRVRDQIHERLETLKSDQFGGSFQKLTEEPKLTKTLSLGKPTSKQPQPYISGGGTGGSGGTRNFLSSGNVAPKSMNDEQQKLSAYNNLSSFQQKQMLQRAMRSKGLSVGPQRPQHQEYGRQPGKYYKGPAAQKPSTGKSPSSTVKLGSGTQYYQGSYMKDKGLLPEHRVYEEMLERTIDRKRKGGSGTEARVHTQANDLDHYFKTDSRELLSLYQEKKRNMGLGAKLIQENAAKKSQKPLIRKSGEQTATSGFYGQKSRNNENVRGSGSHGPTVGKPMSYSSAGAQRSSNIKSYATLEQLNYKHSIAAKTAGFKSGVTGYKKQAGKVYMQGTYKGLSGVTGHHYPANSTSQLQSALYQSYMKPMSSGSRLDLKSGGEKRKSSGNRTGLDSYSGSVKQQTRKKPSDSGLIKPIEKFARSTFGR